MASIKASFAKGLTAINVKTNNFMEENKSKTYISTLENEIRELKLQIGGRLYEGWKAEEATEALWEALAGLLEQIDAKEQEIQVQRERIVRLYEEEKNILGTPAEPEPAPDPDPNPDANAASVPVIYCSQCGTRNGESYMFCRKCGNALKK